VNINHFLARFSSVLMNETGDQTFETLKLLTAGTTGARIGKLINFAVSCLDPEECYLEVGVFTGFTLISANYQNNRHCVGIDSFQPDQIFSIQPADVRLKCAYNLKNYTSNTKLIEGDFRAVTQEMVEKLVGVHFIDGDHNYQAVIDGINWVTPMLAKDAIVIIDDVGYQEITRAITEIADYPGYELFFFYAPLYVGDTVYPVGDKVLHQGLAILRYAKP
jgi:predicted O-methyltransferase YrrM